MHSFVFQTSSRGTHSRAENTASVSNYQPNPQGGLQKIPKKERPITHRRPSRREGRNLLRPPSTPGTIESRHLGGALWDNGRPVRWKHRSYWDNGRPVRWKHRSYWDNGRLARCAYHPTACTPRAAAALRAALPTRCPSTSPTGTSPQTAAAPKEAFVA